VAGGQALSARACARQSHLEPLEGAGKELGVSWSDRDPGERQRRDVCCKDRVARSRPVAHLDQRRPPAQDPTDAKGRGRRAEGGRRHSRRLHVDTCHFDTGRRRDHFLGTHPIMAGVRVRRGLGLRLGGYTDRWGRRGVGRCTPSASGTPLCRGRRGSCRVLT